MVRPKGIPHTEEHKKRISNLMKGKTPKNIELFKAKGAIANIGREPWNKGKTNRDDYRILKASFKMKKVTPIIKNCPICGLTFEWTKKSPKIRCSKECDTTWRKGKTFSKKTQFKKGHQPKNYKGGVTQKNRLIRTSVEMKDWRLKIFNRDGFKCQSCGQVGGELECHHIKGFADYPDLRFDINNGITLCVSCHIKVDKYRARRRKK